MLHNMLIMEGRYSELVKCGTVIGTLYKYFNNRHIARSVPKHYQKFMKTYFFPTKSNSAINYKPEKPNRNQRKNTLHLTAGICFPLI